MDAPFEMKELDVTLTCGGMPLRVLEVVIEEGMSEITCVRAIVANAGDIDFEPLVDEMSTLTITNAGMPIRNFTMRLGAARFKGFVDQTIRYELSFYPDFYFVAFRKNVRKWRDQTTEKIISMVLDESGVTHAWNNTRPCESRPYTVQYRESDQDFVKRLLEYEGIYYTFDDDGTMQLGDASPSLPQLGSFELVETSEGGVNEKPGITTFGKGARFNSGAATVNDHNWKTPSTPLLATEKGAKDTEFETYDYPVGYRDVAIGKILAKLRVEAHSTPKRYVEGSSSIVEFRAGTIFSFSHAEAVSFGGDYLLVHVEHKFATRWAKDAIPKYENTFKAIPSDVPFRPQLTTQRPVIIGNHTAMVRGPTGEEIHTDQWGRAKVQFHWDREAKGTDEDSRWIRTVQEASSSIVISRVGWEVSVGYIDGDPDRPVGLGRQINGQMVPTYPQPGHKQRMTIKTETYPGKKGFNELRMDDSSGSMFMDWHAQKDFQNTVGNDKTEKIGNNYTHLITEQHRRTIEQNQSVEIGANQTKQVGSQYNERVGKDRTETIGGSEKLSIAKSHTLNVNGNDTESVGSLRLTVAGSVSITPPTVPQLMSSLVPSGPEGFLDGVKDQAVNKVMGAAGVPNAPQTTGGGDPVQAIKDAIPTQEEALDAAKGAVEDMVKFKGTIQRSVEKLHLKQIGGAYIKIAGEQVAQNVGKVIAEVVGGLKLTSSIEENITQAVVGKHIRTVGGNVTRIAKGRVTHASKTSDIKIGASMDLKSMEKVEFRGKEIELVAESKFRLETGGLSIELTPDTIKITGNTKLTSSGNIVFKGSPDKLVG